MNYQGKKVLVTGAGGFIGSHLVEELIFQGAHVTALVHYNGRSNWGNLEYISKADKSKIEVILGDITDGSLVRRLVKGKNIVFHLAALIGIPYSYIAPMSYLRTNIEGTVNILEAARDTDIERVICTSTSETYGTAIYTPIDENHPMQGQSPYSASKISADKMAESYFNSFDLPVVTVRPFNTYGPRQSARAIIPTIAMQLLSKVEYLTLGSLTPIRDMTYVSDTVSGFLAAGLADEKCLGEVLNLGTGTGVTIAHIAELMMNLTGHVVPIITDENRVRPGKSEVFELIANADKAKEIIKWTPKFSLEQGLYKVVDYVGNNMNKYKPNLYSV
jgi:NAD dependent epimerase/dehydratase